MSAILKELRKLVGESRSFKALPMEQLAEVLRAPDVERRDVFIGGVADKGIGTLALVRGNLDRLTVPLSLFRPSGRTSPDFSRFAPDDYGRTLKFGDYEATADLVLWELDPDYRSRTRKRERMRAKGFGPSLRRLRKQHGLSQSDFPGVSAKTISRIETGEIERPHRRTVELISKTVRVPPDLLETF